MAVFDTKQIMEIIPHRQPFLLIDTIEELEPGVRAERRLILPESTMPNSSKK